MEAKEEQKDQLSRKLLRSFWTKQQQRLSKCHLLKQNCPLQQLNGSKEHFQLF